MIRATTADTPSPKTTGNISKFFTIVGLPLRLISTLETWRLRHKARMQFARVDARTLRDAGISEAQRLILSGLYD